MLTFFRRIRKRLLGDGATSKYLLYAIGEIALVVIGILISSPLDKVLKIKIMKTYFYFTMCGICFSILVMGCSIDKHPSLEKLTAEENDQMELEIRQRVDAYFEDVKSRDIVGMLSRNAAAYTMNFENAFIENGETRTVTGSWTYVLRKSDLGWQVVMSNGTHIGLSYDE